MYLHSKCFWQRPFRAVTVENGGGERDGMHSHPTVTRRYLLTANGQKDFLFFSLDFLVHWTSGRGEKKAHSCLPVGFQETSSSCSPQSKEFLESAGSFSWSDLRTLLSGNPPSPSPAGEEAVSRQGNMARGSTLSYPDLGELFLFESPLKRRTGQS